jgi:hypothetical protein
VVGDAWPADWVAAWPVELPACSYAAPQAGTALAATRLTCLSFPLGAETHALNSKLRLYPAIAGPGHTRATAMATRLTFQDTLSLEPQ